VAEGVEKSEKSLSPNTPLPRQLSHKPFAPRPIAAAITLTDVFPSFSPDGTYLSSTVFASIFFFITFFAHLYFVIAVERFVFNYLFLKSELSVTSLYQLLASKTTYQRKAGGDNILYRFVFPH